MNISEVLNLVGEFSWNYSNEFLIETDKGNFVWLDPEYEGGDNSITPFEGTFNSWIRKNNIPYARSKGRHRIQDYCGNGVILK